MRTKSGRPFGERLGNVVVARPVREEIMMNKRLSDDDRRAVDLLLDRDNLPVDQLFATPMRGNFESRLDTVEQILALLDHMPVEEPSFDLAGRTMQRIEEAMLEPTATDRTAEQRPILGQGPAHA